METWIEAVGGIRSGGNNKTHNITVTGDISVPISSDRTFGSVIGVTVTIQGDGTLTPSGKGNLLAIGADQTVVLKGDITLKGRDDNGNRVVSIGEKGTFRMEGNSTVMGNNGGGVLVGAKGTFTMIGGTISGNTAEYGSGVYVGGTFTMSGGTISGNIAREDGGGVSLKRDKSTFTMNDGAISDNTAGNGGGVYVGSDSNGNDSIFIMNGGTISGNTANGSGGGVSVDGRSTMIGGTISGNTSSGNGGGVYVDKDGDRFTKTGGTISGNDAVEADRNTAKQGHAVYNGATKNWRNATAGPRMNKDTYGFWLND